VDVPSLLQAEHDENEVRKDFTVSEQVAIGKALEEEIGKRQGQRTDVVALATGTLEGTIFPPQRLDGGMTWVNVEALVEI
jgi:hypothetical protein